MILIPPPEIQSVASQSEARAIAIREVQRMVSGKVNAILVDEKDVVRKGRPQKRIILWDWNNTEPTRWVAWVAQDGTISEIRDITPHGIAPGKGKAKTRHHGEVEVNGLVDDTAGTFIAYDDIIAVVEAGNNFPFPDGRPVVQTLSGNTLGDGNPYEDRTLYTAFYPPELRTPNATTPAAEALAFSQASLRFNKEILGYEGVRGFPSPLFVMIHAGFQYNNAFASLGLCDCFYFGDGDWFLSETALTNTTNLDVVAHEIAHATTYWTAGLDYWGEAGGLNEATSDIFGKATQWWFESGQGKTIPNPTSLDKWTVGGETFIYKGKPTPLRYMYRPSNDGISYDYVSPALAEADPHHSSGPLNRWFYWITNGIPEYATDNLLGSAYVKKGYPYKIPVEKAVKIWFQTIHRNLAPDADYLQAASGAHQSAIDLFGPDSPEAHAVDWTFAAINAIPTTTLPPYITTVYPASAKPGDEVTLTGAQFQPVTTILLNGQVLGQYPYANEHQIKFTLPANASTGAFRVQTQFGYSPNGPTLTVPLTAPSIRSFEVKPMRYLQGETVTASWIVDNAWRVKINGLVVASQGSFSMTGGGPAMRFDLLAENQDGNYDARSIEALAITPDLNGDGETDAYDALAIMANWGKPGITDLNGDGTTNESDLFILRGLIR